MTKGETAEPQQRRRQLSSTAASYPKVPRTGRQDLRKPNKSPVQNACQWVVDKQIEWSLSLLAFIHAHDYLVTGRTSEFVHLQHKIPNDSQGRYLRGYKDVYFILQWVAIFTLVRATIMYKILEPFARWYGVRSKRKVTRFAEQGWQTVYYIISNSVGVYIMYLNPHWLNSRQFWANYPEGHREMSFLMKSYYLIQMGFWLQQIFVLLIEEKRKDFLVMGTHHLVTCNLLGFSLYMNYVRVGNAILCCMDSSDIFLAGTKCLRYLGLKRTSVAVFVIFIISWVYTRHYLYLKILYSVVFESYNILGADILWDPANGSFYSRPIIIGFTLLLSILQLLIIYWFALVLRILYRVLMKGDADDSRSDSEDSDDDDKDKDNDKKIN